MTPRIRRSRAPLLAALSLLAFGLAVGTASAKAAWEARLDAPISRDAEAGTEITVGWSVFEVSGTDRLPFESPGAVFVRLYPMTRGATVTEVVGTEEPAGSGHYVGSIVVPAGGIARVEAGLINEWCGARTCTRWDFLFDLTGDVLVFGPGIGAPAAAPADPPAPTDPATVSVVGPGWAFPILVALAAIAITAVTVGLTTRHGGRTRPSDAGAARID